MARRHTFNPSERDLAHAPSKRRRPPAPDPAPAREPPVARQHDQPWVPTSGLVGRQRRSARRG